jgi:putative transposase
MTPAAFQQWCRTLALAPSTCDFLSTIRGSQPVRRVTSRANNVSGTYPSTKMGVTIQFESHKVELWAILVMDHDPDVLEFFDQPHTFKLRYLGKSGKTPPLATNTLLLWDGLCWTLINPGETTTTLLSEKGQPVQIPSSLFFQLLDTGVITRLGQGEELPASSLEVDRLMDQASPADLRQANERFEKVIAYLQGEKDQYTGIAPRTLHRWVASFRLAEETLGCGYVGLLSRKASQGNRTPKAPQAARELMDTFITEQFETPRHAPAASVYRAYEQECHKRSLPALSARAFYQRIKQRSGPHQTEQREGARAAYREQPWFWELEHTTPRHGSRPFELVHIDHTELDIEVRCSSTGQLLEKPWVTFMMDAYSRRLLAVYLTFDPPSYRSVMMVLRICVQRFERFPQSIVVDGGKEFQSVYFESLLAQYRCTTKAEED